MVKALVTGSAGFVGRHLARALTRRGWEVYGCDPRGASRTDARRVFSRDNAWGRQQYDLVAHCAYHVGGRAAIDGEPRNLARNLELDAAMFDWACETGQRAVLYFSSSAAYPVHLQRQGVEIRLAESDICLDALRMPDARYGWAKLTGERLARAASETGLRVHVVRPFSGYGEDQNPDEYPFPAIVRRVAAGDPTVWGPQGQCRDWIHIDDVIAGALAVYLDDERDPVNLCTGVATEFGELAQRIGRLVGRSVQPRYLTDKPTGVFYRVGDPARMYRHYRPNVGLDEGIRRALRAVGSGG